jgi:hypothetical protein
MRWFESSHPSFANARPNPEEQLVQGAERPTKGPSTRVRFEIIAARIPCQERPRGVWDFCLELAAKKLADRVPLNEGAFE